VLGVVFIVLLLEATRRTTGWIVPAVALAFMAYAYFGPYLPPPWTHRGFDVGQLIGHLFITLEGIDVPKVITYREGVVARLYKGLQGLVKSRSITLVEGTGRLTSPTTVDVDGTTYTATKAVVLATGSYARSLPGLEIGGRVITSYEALNLDHVPAKVVVLGGGVIGVEFASVWRSFGSEDVTGGACSVDSHEPLAVVEAREQRDGLACR